MANFVVFATLSIGFDCIFLLWFFSGCGMIKKGKESIGGEPMKTFLSILLLLVSIVIIASVTVMESKQQGLGVIDGGANLSGQSSMGKDRILNRVIIGAAIVFLVAALAMAIIA